MSYPFQIKSLEEYHQRYKESIEAPEKFWAGVAENFLWKRNGIKCWNGILLNQKLNGLKVQN